MRDALRPARMPLAAVRWVVIDCETSGLDPARDSLLSVGAVCVRGDRIALGECFNARLRPPVSSPAENILIHGIGGDAQLAAPPPAEVLPQFARLLGGGVPVAFDAWFDAEILRRAMSSLGLRSPRRWLDLAVLAPALFPERARACRSLEDWLGEFGIPHAGRHDALLDALATAELLLVLLAEGARQGIATLQAARAAARGSRWLAPL